MNPAQSPATSGRRTLLLLVSGVLLLTFGWMLAGGTRLQAKTETPENAATINGQPITMAEVMAKAKDRLEDLDAQLQQLQVKYQQERQNRLQVALGEMLEERLLALEAKATGKTKEQLLDEGVKTKVGEIGDAEIDSTYEQVKAQQPGLPPKEAILEQIKAYIKQQKEQTAHNAFFAGLRDKYKVEILLQPPRLEIATEGHPAKGPANAPVTIVEFSDFECPFCKQVVPTLEQIKQKYGDQVRVVFRQFPLDSLHPHARKAAEAALCAQEQGKFWEMHDAMFGDQKALEVPALKATAEKLGVDKAKFEQCLDSGRVAQRVKDDERAGTMVGVGATPALFVNGRALPAGAAPFDVIAQAIDQELARKPGKS